MQKVWSYHAEIESERGFRGTVSGDDKPALLPVEKEPALKELGEKPIQDNGPATAGG